MVNENKPDENDGKPVEGQNPPPPPGTPPPASDPAGKPDPPTGDGANDEIKKAVREVLSEMGVGQQRQREGAPARRVDIEKMAEDMVKEASAKLDKEKETESRIAELEKAKNRVEETPRKVRRLTKALWGDEK